MQAPKRLSVKLFVKNPEVVEAEALVPVFQRWIQEKAIENELLIDVADYKHVHHGPGIMLIAHEGDYAYQANDGQVGLSYTLKQHDTATMDETLALALARLNKAAELLHAEESLNGIQFALDTLQVTILDRLNYPNDGTLASDVYQILLEYFSRLGVDASVAGANQGDPREPVRFDITLSESLEKASNVV
ncbi:MAG: hypothetical protein AAFV93_01465 [Chloroflexota bacterium]